LARGPASRRQPETAPAGWPGVQGAFRPGLFEGRRVLVTGGATGIGAAIGLAFAGLGADVRLLSRDEGRLKAAVERLRQAGPGRHAHSACDVRDAARVEAAAAEIGPVDVLVNAAAGNFPAPFAALSENAFNTVVDIVLKGTANVSRSVGGRMHRGDGGAILNVVAGYAWTGAPGVSHSGAAKAGVLNLTKSLAVEWAPKVRVNAVSPGPIDGTEGMRRLGDDLGLRPAVERSVPLGRMGTPDEVAQACVFLASPAASFVTGACLVVDGGQDAKGPFGDLLLG
jgi:NAD(P)-dependent dehydrogenase (short-subunit alcohol dehydrogenase family)